MNYDIEAYLDGALEPQAKAEFEAQLARDAALRDAVIAARRVRDDLAWLAVEKGIRAGEQAFWEKQTKWSPWNRGLGWILGLILLLVLSTIVWQQGIKQDSPAPEQQQPQPGNRNILPTAPDPATQPAPVIPDVPDAKKQAENTTATRNRLFAANFKPYKDESLEPSRRGATEPLPSERFQQLYWEDQHREALVAFRAMTAADQNNDNFLFLKANCLLATGQADEAATLLEQILRNDRTRFMAEARWYLALSYLKAGHSEQAKNLLRSIENDGASPRQADAERLLGQWK